MLDAARTHPRPHSAVPSQAAADARRMPLREPAWGMVDALLALLLLPFGVWFLLIDRVVAGIAWFMERASHHTGGLRRAAAAR